MLVVAAGARTSFFPTAVSAGSITGQGLPTAWACSRGSASSLALRVPFQHRGHANRQLRLTASLSAQPLS